MAEVLAAFPLVSREMFVPMKGDSLAATGRGLFTVDGVELVALLGRRLATLDWAGPRSIALQEAAPTSPAPERPGLVAPESP